MTQRDGQRERKALGRVVVRGIAGFLGGFTLLNILAAACIPHFDLNLWWIDTRPLTPWVATGLLLGGAGALLAVAAHARVTPLLRGGMLVAIGLLLGMTLGNTVAYYRLCAHGLPATALIPVSGYLSAALALVWVTVLRAPSGDDTSRPLMQACATGLCMIAFALAQIFCFGTTDYRGPADVIVAFGAKAYGDGTASTALSDRVRTACELYQEGLARYICFSGGPADGAVHETDVMRDLARTRYHVPAAAILIDRDGLDTAATVRNTVPLFRHLHLRRVLAVSHFYHLPRIKMAYQRAGCDVATVPVHHQRSRASIPYLVCREVVALWAYYLRPITDS